MIQQHIPFIFLAFVTTLIMVQVFRNLAPQIGLVDNPGGRKHHRYVIPLVGGLGMFLGFALATLALDQPLQNHYGLLAGTALLVIIGVLDDRYDVPPRTRLLA